VDRPRSPVGTRAAWAVALVAAASAVAFVTAVQQAVRLVEVNRLAGTCGVERERGCRVLDVRATLDAIHRLDGRSNALLAATGVLLAGAAFAWLLWQHGAHRVLRDGLATPGPRFSPGWAVAWWFVPVANLVVPVVVMDELWRASGGHDATGSRWQDRRLPAVVRWWWACWVTAVAIAVVTRGQSNPATAGFSDVRSNAVALTVGATALAIAGALAVAVVRSVERRLGLARPYEADVPTPAGTMPVDDSSTPADGLDPGQVRPGPRRSAPAAALVLATVVASVAVVATSPSISLVDEPAFGTPSPIATFVAPAGWRRYGDTSLGFVLLAPPEWHETHDGSPALLRLETAAGTDATCLVIDDPPSAGMPLRAVVDELLSQIRDPAVYDLQGEVDARSVAVPAGATERLRFVALRAGVERGYVQYVLVDDRAGWLIGCDSPQANVAGLEPTFERMISTFRFAR